MDREEKLIKLCMKHCREQSYLSAFNALQADTGVRLESKEVSMLHKLITNGEFRKTEQFLEEHSNKGLFDYYIESKSPNPRWEQLKAEDCANWPVNRGGHQMCVDSEAGLIYLFGGWDGHQDLSDLWRYDIEKHQWSLIEYNTGPSARSCHKMVLDTKNQIIYLLGRYLDLQLRTHDAVKSEFYKYDIKKQSWTLIDVDVSLVGGPNLLYDHQMCIDEEDQKLYVYGGRYLSQFNSADSDSSDSDTNNYSGMYVYHIADNLWQPLLLHLHSDIRTKFHCRVGHSMVFDSKEKRLWIFFGQKGKKYFADVMGYHTINQQIDFLFDVRRNKISFPVIGYTHKMTIDVEKREIYLLAGLSKTKDKLDGDVHKKLWIFNIDSRRWTSSQNQINGNESKDCDALKRFAHQLVYDSKNKVHYLFGGNPGYRGSNTVRLNDFWEMKMVKLSVNEILFKMKLTIRLYWYEEMCKYNSYKAVKFLQDDLYQFFNHSDKPEADKYKKLVMTIFRPDRSKHVYFGKRKSVRIDDGSPVDVQDLFYCRSKLFDSLMKYFPRNLRQPLENLTDFLAER